MTKSQPFAFSLAQSSQETGNYVPLEHNNTYDPNQQVWIDPEGNRVRDKMQAKTVQHTTGTGTQYSQDTDDSESDRTTFLWWDD